MKIIQQNNSKDSEYIKNKVIQYNMSILPDEVKSPLEHISFLLKDDVSKIFGGITGTIYFYHLHIDFYGWMSQYVMKDMVVN